MKKLEKKIECALEGNKISINPAQEVEELDKIIHLLEEIEKIAHQQADSKEYIKVFNKLKVGRLIEKLKVLYKPTFVVEEHAPIKEKILEWLLEGKTDKETPSLVDIFQSYLKEFKSESSHEKF